jgi:hypothetical protein
MHSIETLPGPDLDLTERVRRLALYGAGWDGYRAEPASPVAVELACAFVAALGHGEGLEASLDGDGTVNLSGAFGGDRILLAFEGDGNVSVCRREGGTWREDRSYVLRGPEGGVRVPPELREELRGAGRATLGVAA